MNRILVHAQKELERVKRKKRQSQEEIIQVYLNFSRNGSYRDPVLLTVIRVPQSIVKNLFSKEN